MAAIEQSQEDNALSLPKGFEFVTAAHDVLGRGEDPKQFDRSNHVPIQHFAGLQIRYYLRHSYQ
jgi:hypothetical protein